MHACCPHGSTFHSTAAAEAEAAPEASPIKVTPSKLKPHSVATNAAAEAEAAEEGGDAEWSATCVGQQGEEEGVGVGGGDDVC